MDERSRSGRSPRWVPSTVTKAVRSHPLAAVAAVVAVLGLVAGTGVPIDARSKGHRPVAPGARFVAPWGSDAGPGTKAEPWATLSFSLAALGPGDTLSVRGGVYPERITPGLRAGRPDAPIRVQAAPGERPVVHGLLWLRRPSYWAFDGINVTWNPAIGRRTEHMLKLTDGVGWSFSNAEIWGARSHAGVLIAGSGGAEPANWTFSGNCVHDTVPANGTNQDHLVYANTGVAAGPGLIERNLLFNAANGQGIKVGGPSAKSGGAARLTIRHNTVHNTVQSLLFAWQAADNEAYGNIFDTVEPGLGAVRGYQLAYGSNTVFDNVVGHADHLLLNDDGYQAVQDGGGNRFPVDPRFDATSSCHDFRPLSDEARGFGR